MQKVQMKNWMIDLEAMVDKKLATWDKHRKWENGENIHFLWQWEQALIKLDLFWEDQKEMVRLRYIIPRGGQDLTFSGLNRKTFREVEHYTSHWAMQTMHPPIDPMDRLEGIE